MRASAQFFLFSAQHHDLPFLSMHEIPSDTLWWWDVPEGARRRANGLRWTASTQSLPPPNHCHRECTRHYRRVILSLEEQAVNASMATVVEQESSTDTSAVHP